ncbi:MAG: flagellar hook-length control protein FliK [Lachnospiraceae bacterium]|nr:flagellar hook-length control protein FliK [Lachnospiraceae bacterium]
MSFFNFNGMNLGSGVSAYNNIAQAQSSRQTQQASGQAEDTAGIKSGQVVSGEVVEVNDDSVKLKLSGDQYISAKLDSSVNVEAGSSMSFEVKSDGSQIELRPLYANLAASPAAEAALSQAGLPATGANINMVNTMMEEGMSVNRDALRAMARTASAHPTADPSTIVQLSKLELPVTDANINQLENYKNFEHQIINDADNLSGKLSELLGEISGNTDRAILSLVSGENSAEIGELISDLKVPADGEAGQVSEALSAAADGTSKTVITEDVGGETAAASDNLSAKGQEGVSEAGRAVSDLSVDITGDLKPSDTAAAENIQTDAQGSVRPEAALEKVPSQPFMEAAKDITADLEKMGLPEEKAAKLLSGDNQGDTVQFVSRLYEQLSSGEIKYDALKEKLEKLFKTEDFKDMAKDGLLKGMTLKPSDVADKEKIEELYKKLDEQSGKAMEILKNAGLSESPAMHSAQNIKENVHFMNDLNEMMQYVQLPLKMAQEKAHGDLYVYTRNKKQIGKDGQVSALLHLDMETLGPMDVYVSMQTNTSRVNTHFYLQDDETLDFIMANIDRLDERLSAKGFNMHATVTTKDIKEDKGIVDAFLDTASKEGASNPKVSKYSFDVRA